VTIGSNVSHIGDLAFSECPVLERFSVSDANVNFYADCHGALFNRRLGSLLQLPSTYSGSYTVPANVNYIAHRAVYDCDNLEQLVILNPSCTIRDIGCSFWNDFRLHGAKTHSDLPRNILYTCHDGDDCEYCDETTFGRGGACGDNLTWSFNAMTGELAIKGEGAMTSFSCVPPWDLVRREITSISLPEGLTSIGALAFENCTALVELTIPDSVRVIEENAFIGCENLASLTLGSGLERIEKQAFGMCCALNEVVIPESVIYVGEYAFATLSDNLKKITVLNNDCEIFSVAETLGSPEYTIIYGYKNSTAEEYSNAYGYAFVALDGSEEPTEPSEDPTEPSEEPTEPTDKPSEKPEEPSEPSEKPSEKPE